LFKNKNRQNVILGIFKVKTMRRLFLLPILFLTLTNNAYAQQEKDALNSEKSEPINQDPIELDMLPLLDDPDHFMWIVRSPKNVDWKKPESFLNYITLGPFDGQFPDIHTFERSSYHIFSFSDSLTIQTYNPIRKKLLPSVSFSLERTENKLNGFLIHVSEFELVEFNAFSVYGNHYGTTARFRIPLDDPKKNVWLAEGVDNTENCTKFTNNKLLLPYSKAHVDYAVKNKLGTQFQIFTFGEKLLVQTYDSVKDEFIKTEEFEFTSKVNDPFTKLVYFSDFTAEFIAYDCYNYSRYRRFYLKCID